MNTKTGLFQSKKEMQEILSNWTSHSDVLKIREALSRPFTLGRKSQHTMQHPHSFDCFVNGACRSQYYAHITLLFRKGTTLCRSGREKIETQSSSATTSSVCLHSHRQNGETLTAGLIEGHHLTHSEQTSKSEHSD